MKVLAPCPGRVLAMSETPDPVFAQEMVGPGVSIDPTPGPTTVVAPIAGKVVKIHPHAFVILDASAGVGVLVHLGIDTVKLEGAGFEVLAEEGSTVEVGTPMVRWDPAAITAQGLSAVVPVVVMDRPAGSLEVTASGSVTAGDELFEA